VLGWAHEGLNIELRRCSGELIRVSYYRVGHCTVVEYWTPEVLGWAHEGLNIELRRCSGELMGVSYYRVGHCTVVEY
jgi:hypothetical protein